MVLAPPARENKMQTDDAVSFAPVLPLPIIQMAQFRRQMQREGWHVDLARMCVDTGYACECLALAHTSSDERLRRAALTLFAAYDRNAAAATVVLH
jgi:hypothetical protein